MKLFLLLSFFWAPQSPDTCQENLEMWENIEPIYYLGNLDESKGIAENFLQCTELDADKQVAAHLKLSEIHDRIGLHWNTRPVAEAGFHLEKAQGLFDVASPSMQGKIFLAEGMLEYRANLSSKDFTKATEAAENALAIFLELEDLQGQADAVHRLGLINLQSGNFEMAIKQFEQSLILEKQTNAPRPFMVADYYRHMAFAFVRQGEAEKSIPYFIESFKVRRDGGLEDAAMFAAISLTFNLVEMARYEEASEFLFYALEISEKIQSPSGMGSANFIAGVYFEHFGETQKAIEAYQKSLTAAQTINRTAQMERAQQALERVKGILPQAEQ